MAPGPAETTTTVPPAPPTLSPASEAQLQQKYCELVRDHLGSFLDNLFAEFTGLHFHVSWAPPPPHEWEAQSLPTVCSVDCRTGDAPRLAECQACGPRQLARALSTDGDGHHFMCRRGMRNYWLPIRVRGEVLGIAYLQALDHALAPPPARKCAAPEAAPRLPRSQPRALTRIKFARATRFLKLIVQHVQTASLADLRKADMTSARRAVVALKKEKAQLQEALQRNSSPTPQLPPHSEAESHAEQIVHRLLDWIEENHGQPITLRHCAHKLGMNPAYLSGLFSRRVGVPFKTYLTELRLEKAKALLGDPAKTASEVAYATGYASENRFRIAFKKATGLPPRIWRETFRMALSALLAFSLGELEFVESLQALLLG